MRPSWVSLPLLLLSGTLAWSQAQPLAESNFRRFEVHGGPVFNGSNPSNATFGAGFGVGESFTRWGAVQGEFTYAGSSCCASNYVTLTDYLFGPRIVVPVSGSTRVSPFADVLFGGQTLNNSSNHHSWLYNNGSGPAIAVDGGMDLRMTSRLSVRGQFGMIDSRFSQSGASSVVNNRWRAATYIVCRF